MILYFVRHGSAGKSKPNSSQDDKRPLDKDGTRQCVELGRLLAQLDTNVDTIISSPLKRAAQTASLVGNEIGYEGEIVYAPALGKSAAFTAFRKLLDEHAKSDALMLVGHNPTLSSFASLLLTGGKSERAIDFKKGGAARIEYDGRKPAELNWCVTPKLVRSAYEVATTSGRPNTSAK